MHPFVETFNSGFKHQNHSSFDNNITIVHQINNTKFKGVLSVAKA